MSNTNPATVVVAWTTLRILGLPMMRGQEQAYRQDLGGSRGMQVKLSLLQRFPTNVAFYTEMRQHTAKCGKMRQNAAKCGNGEMRQFTTKCGSVDMRQFMSKCSKMRQHGGNATIYDKMRQNAAAWGEMRQFASGASVQLARLLLN